MVQLPDDLDGAIAQAMTATETALSAGYTRLQIELQFPELKPMPIAEKFLPLFADLGNHLKVLFPDAGAAALARRDWGEVPCVLRGMFEAKGQIHPEDEAILLVAPSSVEVAKVEEICQAAGDRPVVLLTPKLEDLATVGLGYAGRQLRERFLNSLETCYFIKPLDGAAIFRCYPAPWQVWRETSNQYELMAETPQRPTGEMLNQLFMAETTAETSQKPARKSGLFSGIQGFLRALSQ